MHLRPHRILSLVFALVFGGSLLEIVQAGTNTFPIKLRRGRMILQSSVNGSKPYSFLLDSGCTISTLHPGLVEELKLTPSGTVLINGIAGQERADTYRGLVFQWEGELSYSPSRVASIPSERSHSRRTDGVLGSGFFRRFVVEMDPTGPTIRLHHPTNFQYQGKGEVIPFRFRGEVPVIKGTIVLPGRDPLEAEFELDTGCESGLCLGAPFVQKHQLLEAVKSKDGRKVGIGGGVNTQNTALPLLRLGKTEIRNVDADFFNEGSPVDEPQAGHLGMEVLHQFKVIFDYSRKQLILEPKSS